MTWFSNRGARTGTLIGRSVRWPGGLPKITFHELRRSLVSFLTELGTPPRRRLGSLFADHSDHSPEGDDES